MQIQIYSQQPMFLHVETHTILAEKGLFQGVSQSYSYMNGKEQASHRTMSGKLQQGSLAAELMSRENNLFAPPHTDPTMNMNDTTEKDVKNAKNEQSLAVRTPRDQLGSEEASLLGESEKTPESREILTKHLDSSVVSTMLSNFVQSVCF
jgi:hypothetical protein